MNEIVVCKSGKESYGIDIKNILTIERVSKLTRIPASQEYLIGVMNLRGDIIPVVDFEQRLHGTKSDLLETSRIVIVNYETQTIGIMVDDASQVVPIEDENMKSSPITHTEDSLTSLVYVVDDTLVSILNLRNFFELN